jgi:hypothetical protein
MICHPRVCELRINATQPEGLQRGLYTQLPHLIGQPFRGRGVDGRSCAMVALGVEGLKHARDTLLERAAWGLR